MVDKGKADLRDFCSCFANCFLGVSGVVTLAARPIIILLISTGAAFATGSGCSIIGIAGVACMAGTNCAVLVLGALPAKSPKSSAGWEAGTESAGIYPRDRSGWCSARWQHKE